MRSVDALLTEINECFQHEPYPGDFNLVVHNAPSYDFESLQIREQFKLHTWQTIPDELLLYERAALSFLSMSGFKYYLPAFMQFAVREYRGSDSIPDDLIHGFTLPTELDTVLSALSGRRFQFMFGQSPEPAQDEHQQAWLRNMNGWVHRFIARYRQYSPAQGRAILHFLQYMRDEHGEEYLHDEPAVAIERYWFQFARE